MRRIAGFVLVGGSATVIYATLAWAAATGFGLSMPLASPLAYGLAALWSFFGHRVLTFRGASPHPRTRTRFMALALSGYAIAFAVPAIVDGFFGGRPEASILLTCLAIPLANYFVLSRYVFRERVPA